jgi:putative colanic acid biosynthesis acetyltransferase WcaB
MLKSVFQDWNYNKSNIKARLILIGFRIAHLAINTKLLFIILIPHLIIYRVIVEWFLGVELPYKTIIGKGLKIYHGQALVVNDGTIIGFNCTLRNSTTIGNKIYMDGNPSKSPVIGDNVDIGCNVSIIGPVVIGDNVIIGAGSVVVKNVPSNSIVAGNPARVIKFVD